MNWLHPHMVELLEKLHIKPAHAQAVIDNATLALIHAQYQEDDLRDQTDRLLGRQIVELLYRDVIRKDTRVSRLTAAGLEVRVDAYVLTFEQMMEAMTAAYTKGRLDVPKAEGL